MIAWTDDRVEALKKLWEAGLSANQCAAELNAAPFNHLPSLSRNAAIGKVHRMGLGGRAKDSTVAAPRVRKVRPVQYIGRPRAANVKAAPAPVSVGSTALVEAFEVEQDQDVLAYDNVIPMTQRVDLLGLTASTCRWPIGDPQSPDFAFCGAKPLAGVPYCAHHTRIAYQPVPERRRQRPTR